MSLSRVIEIVGGILHYMVLYVVVAMLCLMAFFLLKNDHIIDIGKSYLDKSEYRQGDTVTIYIPYTKYEDYRGKVTVMLIDGYPRSVDDFEGYLPLGKGVGIRQEELPDNCSKRPHKFRFNVVYWPWPNPLKPVRVTFETPYFKVR
jgi:hypothetical protein